MKDGIKQRRAYLMDMVDRYTRGVNIYCNYNHHEDACGCKINPTDGASKYQLHEQAKAIRREVLALDKLIMSYSQEEKDRKLTR